MTQQVPVGGKKVLNVQLKDDTQTLDEVVVVAYGTARKSDLTGATASLRPDANDASKTASFNNLLQGKVAGAECNFIYGCSGSCQFCDNSWR